MKTRSKLVWRAWQYSWRAKLVIAVTAGLVTPLFIEVALRVATWYSSRMPMVSSHRVAGYSATPDLYQFPKRWDRNHPPVLYSTTSDGFRVTSRDKVSVKDLHLLLLGDSFVFGWCANDEDTLGWTLREITGMPVISQGFNGYSPEMYLRLLSEHLRIAPPEALRAVAVLICENDLADMNCRVKMGRAKPFVVMRGGGVEVQPPMLTWRDTLCDHSYLAKMLLYRDCAPNELDFSALPIALADVLRQMKEAASRARVPIVFFFFQHLDRMEVDDALKQTVVSACAAKGVHLQDISGAIVDAGAEFRDFVAIDGSHWNKKACLRVAQIIRDYLAGLDIQRP